MYSPLIVEQRLRLARKAGQQYRRLPRDTSIEISQDLEKLRYDDDGKLRPDDKPLSRPLTIKEQEFIDSESVLCKCDFEYYFTRYHSLELDEGVCDQTGIGAPKLLESQKKYIKLLGKREEECYAEHAKSGFTTGIRAYFHKTRQVAATATARGFCQHRRLFWFPTRSLAASLDASRVGELFKRDHTSLDFLPFWLKPKLYPDVKDMEIGFPFPLSSRISYQAENADTGIGTGSQNMVSHLTEVDLWKFPGKIEFSFVPSIPGALSTLHIQESTADGKGYWFKVTESARHKRRGYESWVYAFIPWYMNSKKWRANPPDDWIPDEHTLRHVELIERTSPEFSEGITFRPSKEQLYWWETTRAAYMVSHRLAEFLTNYPATPEQSFQNPNKGALPAELIEAMEQEIRPPVPYEIDINSSAERTGAEYRAPEGFPPALYTGGSSIRLSMESDETLLDDPRGVLLMWEPPRKDARYIMGLDPSVGITNWNRVANRDFDKDTDNGAIEIFRVDAIREMVYTKDGKPDIDPKTKETRYVYRDLQVAEYAAPVDATDIARIANVLGTIYKGIEDDRCELIFESYPGPGILTTQELLRLNYDNLWMWETIGGGVAEQTSHIGWRSWGESQRVIWYRSRRHLIERRAVIRSRYLHGEYANAIFDPEKNRGRAAYGFHDDRIQSANMCFWAGHKWTYDVDRPADMVSETPERNWQTFAPGIGEQGAYHESVESAMDGWWE